jgi:hypothetical protein
MHFDWQDILRMAWGCAKCRNLGKMTLILTVTEAPESWPNDWSPALIPFLEHAEALIKN